MTDENAQLQNEIEALKAQLRTCEDAAQRLALYEQIEALRERISAGPQLTGGATAGRDTNIATNQDIRNVQAQDYSQGNIDKRSFNFITIYQSGAQQAFQEPAWEHVDWDAAEQRYKRELLRQYGTMHIFGMSQAVPLGQIVTDVYVLDKPSAFRRFSIEELERQHIAEVGSTTNDERQPVLDLVKKERRIFLFGKPGAGKTTFLKHLTMQAVNGKLSRIPIFLELRRWDIRTTSLMEEIVRQFAICGFPNAQPFIEAILRSGRGLFLFDGLDEVPLEDDRRRRTINAVRDLAQQYANCQYVITCRTAAVEHVFDQFRYSEMADFTMSQIKGVVQGFFQETPEKAQRFLEAFAREEHQGIRDLARTPLLLSMLCLAFDETMHFPQRRSDLYEEALDALLKKWDSSRSIQRSDPLWQSLTWA